MESTGSYWKPVFNVLEDSAKVYLANPHEVKDRKGHKTDDKDGWWLAHLLRHAMIHPSFIPPRPLRELRDLTRGGNGSMVWAQRFPEPTRDSVPARGDRHKLPAGFRVAKTSLLGGLHHEYRLVGEVA
jgi:hypothetical protein